MRRQFAFAVFVPCSPQRIRNARRHERVQLVRLCNHASRFYRNRIRLYARAQSGRRARRKNQRQTQSRSNRNFAVYRNRNHTRIFATCKRMECVFGHHRISRSGSVHAVFFKCRILFSCDFRHGNYACNRRRNIYARHGFSRSCHAQYMVRRAYVGVVFLSYARKSRSNGASIRAGYRACARGRTFGFDMGKRHCPFYQQPYFSHAHGVFAASGRNIPETRLFQLAHGRGKRNHRYCIARVLTVFVLSRRRQRAGEVSNVYEEDGFTIVATANVTTKSENVFKGMFRFFKSLFTKQGWKRVQYELEERNEVEYLGKNQHMSGVWIALALVCIYWLYAFIVGMV